MPRLESSPAIEAEGQVASNHSPSQRGTGVTMKGDVKRAQGSSAPLSKANTSVDTRRTALKSTGLTKPTRRRYVAGTAFVDAHLNWLPSPPFDDSTAQTEVVEDVNSEADNPSSHEDVDLAAGNSLETITMDRFILAAEAGGFLESDCFGVIGPQVMGFLGACGGLLDELLDKLIASEKSR